MTLTPSGTKQLSAGDRAPDFALRGTDDKIYTLDSFTDYKGLLIIFMCNHCPYVLAKVEEMHKLHEEFGLPAAQDTSQAGDKIAIVGINSNDPDYPGEGFDNMKTFVQEQEIPFPYLLDDTQAVAKAYGATCTPDPFLFDENHRLVFHGKLTDAMQPSDTPTERTMYDTTTKLLNDKTIENWFDPSLGCSIKWR